MQALQTVQNSVDDATANLEKEIESVGHDAVALKMVFGEIHGLFDGVRLSFWPSPSFLEFSMPFLSNVDIGPPEFKDLQTSWDQKVCTSP